MEVGGATRPGSEGDPEKACYTSARALQPRTTEATIVASGLLISAWRGARTESDVVTGHAWSIS